MSEQIRPAPQHALQHARWFVALHVWNEEYFEKHGCLPSHERRKRFVDDFVRRHHGRCDDEIDCPACIKGESLARLEGKLFFEHPAPWFAEIQKQTQTYKRIKNQTLQRLL